MKGWLKKVYMNWDMFLDLVIVTNHDVLCISAHHCLTLIQKQAAFVVTVGRKI